MGQRPDTIGALSKATGVKVTTIRYYESIGLLPEPARSGSGQRVYDASGFERLEFIRHARDLGFSMETIRDLINLQTDPSDDCSVVDQLARQHLDGVQIRIRQLQTLENELKHMIKQCRGGKIDNCSILGSLKNHENCLEDAHERIPVTISPK